jgi:hypothetical protein
MLMRPAVRRGAEIGGNVTPSESGRNGLGALRGVRRLARSGACGRSRRGFATGTRNRPFKRVGHSAELPFKARCRQVLPAQPFIQTDVQHVLFEGRGVAADPDQYSPLGSSPTIV